MLRRAFTSRLSLETLALVALGAVMSCNAHSEEKTCDLLSISECGSRPYCAVKVAQQVNANEQCLAAAQPVSCTDLKQECDDALSLARDDFDQVFVLSNTCVPTGWQEEDDPKGEIVNWPECE